METKQRTPNNFGGLLVIDLSLNNQDVAELGPPPPFARFLYRDVHGVWYWTSSHPILSTSYTWELIVARVPEPDPNMAETANDPTPMLYEVV